MLVSSFSEEKKMRLITFYPIMFLIRIWRIQMALTQMSLLTPNTL